MSGISMLQETGGKKGGAEMTGEDEVLMNIKRFLPRGLP